MPLGQSHRQPLPVIYTYRKLGASGYFGGRVIDRVINPALTHVPGSVQELVAHPRYWVSMPPWINKCTRHQSIDLVEQMEGAMPAT